MDMLPYSDRVVNLINKRLAPDRIKSSSLEYVSEAPIHILWGAFLS